MLMKSIPRFISVALVTSFLFSFITPSVYATDFQEYDYWTYWYVEQSTGVSAEDVKSTDAGISNGEYIASNGGGTRQDAYNWIKDKYDNAINATAKGIDYYYNAVDDIYNKSVDYAVKGYYTAENAIRKTVDNAGKAIYDVSSSNFWSGFYNSMYNGNGSKTIYNDGASSATGTVNGHNISISYAGIVYEGEQIGLTQSETDIILSAVNNSQTAINLFSTSTQLHDNANGGYCYLAFRLNVDGVSCYIANARYITSNLQFVSGQLETTYYGYTLTYNVYSGYDRLVENYIYFRGNVENAGTSTEQIPQPSQMGFIIGPLTGDRIPVYTDPSLNPFVPNPNGTVTINGTDYPIYVDPIEISPVGWLWILEYLDKQNNSKPSQNPYGQPWNTQNDGTILGGLFSGLIQDIASLFDKIAKSIGDLIAKLVNIITDALKNFLTFLVGDIEGYSDLFESSPTSHFDMVEDLYDLLLQCMGVNS